MAFLDDVMVEEISTQAKQVDLGRLLLIAVAGLFYGIGWLSAKGFTAVAWMCRGLVTAVKWSVAAVRLGWREGRRPALARS